MNTLGFRKNDYKHLTSDLSDEDSDSEQHESNIPFSDVLNFHDEVWYIWENLKFKADEMNVPIFDIGTYPQFLSFVTGNNPYFE